MVQLREEKGGKKVTTDLLLRRLRQGDCLKFKAILDYIVQGYSELLSESLSQNKREKESLVGYVK